MADKYKFYQQGNNVIAVGRYKGKTVRGIAKCAVEEGDVFDFQKGKELAAARCSEKIAKKKVRDALRTLREAADVLEEATRYLVNKARALKQKEAMLDHCSNWVESLLESYKEK